MAGAWLACAALLLSGCGDDAAEDPPDASTEMDAGDDDDNGGSVARRDARVLDPADDLVPDCDRFNPLSCTGGQVCQLVVRRAADQQGFELYPGCVDQPTARAEGDPCEPFGGFADPYELPGLRDEVHLNPCEPGLFCAPDLRARGLNRCQQACASGRTGEAISPCPGNGQYCWADASPIEAVFQEVCVDSDDCDPSDPDACGAEAGCFLRFNDALDGAISICLPLAEAPLSDGEPCEFVNDCNAGSSCWGPSGTPRDEWGDDALRCRRGCGLGTADGDAGAEAASGEGRCPEGLSCEDLGPTGLDFSAISVDFGQCE